MFSSRTILKVASVETCGLLQTTGVDSTFSQSQMPCRVISCWRSWRNCGCPANSRATCLRRGPSVRCWTYLWTVSPRAQCAPAPSVPQWTASPSSPSRCTALSEHGNLIDPRPDQRTGRRTSTRPPCCRFPTWRPNEADRPSGTATEEQGGRRVPTARTAAGESRTATQRSASTFPHSEGGERHWPTCLSSMGRKVLLLKCRRVCHRVAGAGERLCNRRSSKLAL